MADQSKEMNVVQLTLSGNDIFARRELPWCDRTAVADYRRELWRPKITGRIGAVPMCEGRSAIEGERERR